MLTTQKILHIVSLTILSIIYAAYIIQLLHPSDWTILFLCLYFIIFFLYTLKTYGIFHYPPTQPNEHLSSTNINAIFKFKLVQERRAQIQDKIKMKASITKDNIQEYLTLQKTSSFCDYCQNIQPPRAYHCAWCNACIMGKQYHSMALGFCIGENNQIYYLNYVFASTVLCTYSFGSLVLAQMLSGNFQKMGLFACIYFYIVLLGYLMMFLFFYTTFTDLILLIRANETFCERTHPVLGKLPLFSAGNTQKDKLEYSNVVKGLFDFSTLGEVSSWISQVEQGIE